MPVGEQLHTARRGRTLGVDVGRARVGLASSDPDALIATPVDTLRRDAAMQRCVGEILEHVRELDAVAVYVGLPTSMSGAETASTQDAREYAQALATRLQRAGSAAGVFLVDERLSTVAAQRGLQASGRTVKNSRSVIDQAAAVAILQDAIDAQRRTGSFTGTRVAIDPDHGPTGPTPDQESPA
ncbi:MAG: Holliday junction resolvase RuvX [Micrococcus sp.]|nr:Holliday junction resolvase RuvX [Micrococcus sp.]